jgi:hypothetical protein
MIDNRCQKNWPNCPFGLLTAILIAFTLFTGIAHAEFDEDVRLWQTLGFTFHDGENWRVSAHAQNRLFDEGKFLGAWLLFPTVQYKAHPNLDLGLTYLLEDIRGEPGTDYTRLHIFWLHASSHWALNENWKFSMRHVLGLRAVESRDDYWISRHKFAFSRKLKNAGPLVALGASTELFYDYDDNRLFENRFVPLSGTFKLTEQARLSLYLMAQSKRFANRSGWETACIFGQSLSYKW